MKPYDYARREGVEEVSWERFAEMAAQLTEALAPRADILLGIARAGLFPATAISMALRREFYPVRLTRRLDDVVRFEQPVWRVDVPAIVAGQRVAVIDEIADTGLTLALVAARAMERGASHVLTASLVSHSWADPRPDVTALLSDALVIFPWDRRIYQGGQWQPHPELEAALAQQRSRPPR
ncbi:MAG: phosphoribosyltransferase [Bacteroidota bacterium]